jgi:hypothetical protein
MVSPDFVPRFLSISGMVSPDSFSPILVSPDFDLCPPISPAKSSLFGIVDRNTCFSPFSAHRGRPGKSLHRL